MKLISGHFYFQTQKIFIHSLIKFNCTNKLYFIIKKFIYIWQCWKLIIEIGIFFPFVHSQKKNKNTIYFFLGIKIKHNLTKTRIRHHHHHRISWSCCFHENWSKFFFLFLSTNIIIDRSWTWNHHHEQQSSSSCMCV